VFGGRRVVLERSWMSMSAFEQFTDAKHLGFTVKFRCMQRIK